MPNQTPRPVDWHKLLNRLHCELGALEDVERRWLARQIAEIGHLQVELDAMFRTADGPATCSACLDNCCGCGRHHLTLTNLLAYLLAGETPPVPDFNSACPFLDARGCRLPVARRPYNCITFFCETLDERLDHGDREQLRRLDRRLRRAYQRVAERYPAASLRGLWIALERVRGGHLLFSPGQDVLK
jgi:hypothetical protein